MDREQRNGRTRLRAGRFCQLCLRRFSGDGSVVVGDSMLSMSQAFRWTASGGMVGLGFLPPSDDMSTASGVSADGSTVVGYSRYDGSIYQAFRWTPSGGMVGLGFLPGASLSIASGFPRTARRSSVSATATDTNGLPLDRDRRNGGPRLPVWCHQHGARRLPGTARRWSGSIAEALVQIPLQFMRSSGTARTARGTCSRC